MIARGGGRAMIARGGGRALIACGGGRALIACGGGRAMIARGGGRALIACGGGRAPIACGMILFLCIRALDRIIKSDLSLDIFDLRFHEARNADLSFQRHFFRDDFTIIRFTLVSYFFGVCLKISAFVRCIVVQHINRLFARVQASPAKMRLSIKNSGFTKLVLKPAALHILIRAFINSHVDPPVSSFPPATAAGTNNDLRPPARPAHTPALECSSTGFHRHTPFRLTSWRISASQKL